MLSLSFGVCDEWKAEAGAQEQRLQDGRRLPRLFGRSVEPHTDKCDTIFVRKLQSP